MEREILFFNGIDGASGNYLLPPMTLEQVVRLAGVEDGARMARGGSEDLDARDLGELKWSYQRATARTLGPREGIDPKNLAEAGWGVIFAHNADPAIREALHELLEHRQKQAGLYYKEYTGVGGYRPSETKWEFLARHGAGPGPADPRLVPYYLLIVGDPETIPYRFQHHLAVQYAVGRIHFDTLESYAHYARSVVEAETGKVNLPRRATFVGVRNADDPATQLITDDLVRPLTDYLARDHWDWTVQTVLAAEASKARLVQLLEGDETPALLFTASHGIGFPQDDPRQLVHQGALLCQDWPGPHAWHEPIPQDFYFAADDIASDARLLGLVAFHFASYGAGTARLDDFAHQDNERTAIAPHAFVAKLPERLLSHPRGGALAVVGTVGRSWSYSFRWPQNGAQVATFGSVLRGLMAGYPIGSAIEYFNVQYAELATMLSEELREIRYGKKFDDLALAWLWTANNDARSYVITGDPAVRLSVASTAVWR